MGVDHIVSWAVGLACWGRRRKFGTLAVKRLSEVSEGGGGEGGRGQR